MSVFCDLIGKRVLFATVGKAAATWGAVVAALGELNGHPRAITEVLIDMSPAEVAGCAKTSARRRLWGSARFRSRPAIEGTGLI